MNAETVARVLAIQFNYTAWVITANLKGLSDADALRQPAPAGNCANWVAGHIVHARAGTLALVGAEPPFAAGKYARYDRGSSPVTAGGDAAALAEIVADLAATQEPLLAALPGLTDDALAAKAPFSPGDDANETVGSLLVGLAFHEAYHAGQLGVLRRLGGHEGAVT
jgi:hypothetical protein